MTTSHPVRPLPVLDIRLYDTNRAAFVQQLGAACRDVGFFVLRHDVPVDLVQRQLQETRHFFEQHTLAQKMEISYEHSPSFRGYMRSGEENTAGAVDSREQIEYGVEYEDNFIDSATPRWPPYERLKGHNPWPAFQPTLQTTTELYIQHIVPVADRLRKALGQVLMGSSTGADDDNNHNALDELFTRPYWFFKLSHYPPKSAEWPQGVGAHTDTNFLTLLIPDSPGLEVYDDGTWVPVKPPDLDCCICNLGEQVEILSHGLLRATPHRVVDVAEPRTSVALFYNANLEATIAPMPVVSAASSTRVWQRPKSYDSLLPRVGDNTLKRLARSHPLVFARHYADCELTGTGQVVPKKETF